jgi:pilus assembly protein Flp/PilA
MTSLKATIRRFWADESGANAIEYAMIAGTLAVTIAATVYATGGNVRVLYEKIAASFE